MEGLGLKEGRAGVGIENSSCVRVINIIDVSLIARDIKEGRRRFILPLIFLQST